jgi:RHS repeat-associated protein
MKLAKLTLIFSLICLCQVSILAQTQPNLENGFKPYGTYGGSDIDSVNLSNGNLIVHIPMPFNFPQRGEKLSPKMVVRMSSKAWAVSTFLGPNGAHSNYWNLGFGTAAHVAQIGTGVGLDSTLDLSLHRYNEVESGATATGYFVGGYYITTWDGGTHQLHAPSNAPADSLGVPMSFDAIDQSGYHVDLSTPDSGTGIPTSGVITDREGTRYQIGDWARSCSKPTISGAFTTSTPADRSLDPFGPNIEEEVAALEGLYFGDLRTRFAQEVDAPPPTISTTGSTSFTTCTEAARISSVTDVNGNVIYSSFSGTPGDTMGRSPDVLGNIMSTTDFSGCVSTNPNSPVNSATIYSYQGKGGITNQVKLCMANYSVQTNFGISVIAEVQNAPTPVQSPLIQSLIVTVVFSDPTVGPNFTGSRWTFNYDSYINLTDIGLPTGGSIHYDWAQAALPHCGSLTPVSRVVTKRTTNDSHGNIAVTNYSWGTPSGGVMSNTVTDPLNNDTVHIFTTLDGSSGCQFYETSTQSYQGLQSSGSLLKQVDTTYSTPTHFSDAAGANGGFGNILSTIIKTTIKQNGQTKVSQITRSYDQGPGNTRPIVGSVVTEQVTDWDGSTVLRQTENAYQWQQTDVNGNQPYLLANLLDLPARSVTKAASGCMMAETTYGYDEFSLAPSGMGPAQHLNAAPNPVRGNQTSVNRWLSPLSSGNCIQAPALTSQVSVPAPSVTSHTKWFDSGVMAQAIDPLNHTTTFSTDSAYFGTYVTQTCSPTTNGVTHCVSGTYDFNTGLITSFTNENATSQAIGTTPGDSAHTGTYSYDNMFRLTSAQAPPDPDNGGLSNTNNFYFSAPNVFPVTAQRVKSVTGAPSDSTTSLFDGLGRPYQTQHVLPSNIAKIDTIFDVGGNLVSISNPYFSTSDSTYGTTKTAYDAFARPTQVKKQDGSMSFVNYNVAVSSAGTCNDTQDEAGRQRRACADVLGRLTEVDEPGGSSAGVPATASVSVAGGLNPVSVTPSPLYLAAAGTAMSSLTMADGSSHTFYFDTNQHLCHLFWNSAGGWQNQDLTDQTESGSALIGSSLSAVLFGSAIHVFYQGTNQHIYDMEWTGTAWQNLDLTTLGGATAISGTKLSAVVFGVNSPTLFYEGTNQHFYIVYWAASASVWANADMSSITGQTTLMATNSSVSSGFYGSGFYGFYLGTNQHLITIYWSGSAWATADVTTLSGGALATVGSALTTLSIGAGSTPMMTFYEGPSQHVYSIYWTTSSVWQTLDFTSFSGATNVAAAATAFTNSSPSIHAFYFGSNQHLDDINWNGSAWVNSDLTSLSGATVTGATGSALSSHGTSAGNTYHVFTTGVDQHIYDTYYTPSPAGWHNADLFAFATNYVVDSGTVSLTIPGATSSFTATVCYGASINPSCSGKSINVTANDVANALAAVLNGTGSPVTTTVTGATLNLTWQSSGDVTPVIASLTSNSDFPAQFPSGSFTSTEASFSFGVAVGSPTLTSPQVTLYQYDALGNLLRVDQKGSAPSDSTQWRTRTFTYDSLSRLLTATNPESGTISYLYDADGELLQKISPAANQTAGATQTVSYCYDALHRVIGKGYGAQSCPLTSAVVSYGYDSGANAKGKLTSLIDQAGTASYTYDVMGRIATEARTLTGAGGAAIPKTLSYKYNLDGSLKELHYPSGAVVTYTPDSAGRTLSAVDGGNGINYITGATYGPDGSLTGFVSDNSGTFAGITSAFSYNKRLQPVNMSATAPSQTLYSVGYDFHVGNGTTGADNGNVFGIYNYKDRDRDQTFTYDPLNRLTSAQNTGTDCTQMTVNAQPKTKYWGNTYAYDAWGNVLQKNITKCGAEHLSVTADGHNWVHSSTPDYQYDAAGNMTYDATASLSYTFDQENRITGAGGYTYIYDSDGNRVRKSNGTLAENGTLYWDMTPGVVAETDLAGTTKSEYVFFGGERVARRDGKNGAGGVFYYFSDHLKTASVVTDAAGNIKAESDYYPWGGELQFVNNDSNHYKFTGKERDTETWLDYFGARYYSNGLGRWVSADWSPTPVPVPYADFGDPQSLNLYNFVGGEPASKADPDGHAGPGDVLQFIQVVKNFTDDPGGFVKSLFTGAGKQWASNFHQNVHKFGQTPPPANPKFSNDVERGGAQLFTAAGTAASYAAIFATKGESEPCEVNTPSLVYRGGSATLNNLTPRPGIDTTGLSTYDTLEAATPPGGKAQVIDTSKLKSLMANPDSPPPGHVSITPGTPEGVADWAASRGTGQAHPYTQEVQNAIVDTVKRPKE